MNRYGHLGITLIIASPLLLLELVPRDQALLLSGVMIWATSIPDIDLALRKSFLLRQFVTHRGFTHTLLFAILFGTVTGSAVTIAIHAGGSTMPESYYVFGLDVGAGVAIATMVSILGHIAGDTLTHGNKPFRPLWPFSNRDIRFGICRASNETANFLLLTTGVLLYGTGMMVSALAGFGVIG